MTITYPALIDKVLSRGPFEDRAHAQHAITATLTALRSGLLDDETQWLAEGFEAELAETLHAVRFSGELSPALLVQRATQIEGVRPGLAVEHVQIVCQALAETLSSSTLTRLRRHLPQLADLFEPAAYSFGKPAAFVIHESQPYAPSTLATGRGGSSHPLSSAHPGSDHPLSTSHPQPAHEQSVARTDNPHAQTKLSSSHGLTQERNAESLATKR